MINTLIGQKIDQTQKFLENGKRIPVTEIVVSQNAILQVKTVAKDAYAAIQLGFGTKKNANNALVGHSKKANLDIVPRVVREVALPHIADADLPKAGDFITVDSVFAPGDIITVTGTSKGKGFAGVVKRHNFRGGPKTHGQSDRERAPGSIGQTTTPGRVYKGKKMAGRMGSDTKTVSNLTVVAVDGAKGQLLVAGLVPGHKKTIVFITKTGVMKKYVPLLEEVEKQKAVEALEAEKIAAEAPAEEPKAEAAEQAPAEQEAAAEVKAEAESATQDPAVEEKAKEVVVEAEVEEKKESEVASDAIKEEVSEDATSTSNVAEADVAEVEAEEKK